MYHQLAQWSMEVEIRHPPRTSSRDDVGIPTRTLDHQLKPYPQPSSSIF